MAFFFIIFSPYHYLYVRTSLEVVEINESDLVIRTGDEIVTIAISMQHSQIAKTPQSCLADLQITLASNPTLHLPQEEPDTPTCFVYVTEETWRDS